MSVQISSDGNILQNVYDGRTGQYFNYQKVASYFDGRAMTDAFCDGVIYRKYNNLYWKRAIGDFIDSAWFPLNGNGNAASTSGTDDSSNLRAIFELGRLMKKKVILRRPPNPNNHYRVDNPIVFGVSDINIEAEEGVVLNGTNLASGYLLYIVGSTSGIPPANNITTTLTEAVSKGSYTIKVADIANLAVNDWIQIKSIDPFDEQRPTENIKKSEFSQVLSIDTTNKILTLNNVLQDDYPITTTTIGRMYWCENIKLKNITFKGKGADAANSTLVQLNQCKNVVIDNCKFIDNSESALQITNGYNITVNHCSFERINKLNYGDGIVVNGSYFVNVLDCFFADCRHGFDAGNLDVNRHILVEGCRVTNCLASGLSQHGGGDYTTFANNYILNCGGGIVNRSRNFTAIGNTILGSSYKYPLGLNNYYAGILIGDGVNNEGYKGKSGIGLKLIGNTIEDCSGNAISILSNLQGAIISGNICKGFKYSAISLTNGTLHEDVQITNNTFDCSLQNNATDNKGIWIYQIKSGQFVQLKNFHIKENIFKNIYVDGVYLDNSSSALKSQFVFIEGNYFSYRGGLTGVNGYGINLIQNPYIDCLNIKNNKFVTFSSAANKYTLGTNTTNSYIEKNYYRTVGTTTWIEDKLQINGLDVATVNDVATKLNTGANTSLAGTGERAVSASSTGQPSATYQIIERRVTDADITGAISGATFNSSNNFTASIIPTNSKNIFTDQWFAVGSYKYEAVSTNVVMRIPLG